MTQRLRKALQDAAGHLFAASTAMPTDWQRAKVRQWADKAGKLAFASADTHPKDGDVKQAPLVSGAVGEAETPNPRSQMSRP